MIFLAQNVVVNYFAENEIKLRETKGATKEYVDHLFLKACELGNLFSGFILVSTINADRNGIETNFDSEEDLYECYTAYMIGASGTGKN